MKTLQEIKNMTAADLKAAAGDLTCSLAGLDIDGIFASFIDALIDAKTRDEKLAQQGDLVAELQAKIGRLEAEAALRSKALENETQHAQQLAEVARTLKRSLEEANEKIKALSRPASFDQAALVQAAALLNHVISTQAASGPEGDEPTEGD